MSKLLKIILIILLGTAGVSYFIVINSFPEETPLEIKAISDDLSLTVQATPTENKPSQKTTIETTPVEAEKVDLLVQTGEIAPQLEKPVEQKVITTTPLVGSVSSTKSNLTPNGAVTETNIRRQQNGLAPLSINTKLTLAAQNKVNDMFARQYFEHDSPTGEGPSDLADAVGYDYLMVGENLALGNYSDNKNLLQAWMDSPGHRANILNPKYTEIGIAVKFGTYDGYSTWLAVQEFGRPASDCPAPNPALESEIATSKELANQLEEQVSLLYNEIQAMQPKNGTVYTQKVEVYNVLVAEYNVFIEKLKLLIINYNTQVKTYNDCI